MNKERFADKLTAQQMGVGDHVLLGGSYASAPGFWFLGTVLWVGDEELLVQRFTLQGEPWVQLALRLDVRAIGTIEELVLIQRRAAEETRDLARAIDDCETALGRARQALHNRLEEMHKDGLAIIPADFRKMQVVCERIRQRAGSQDVGDCHG